MPAVADREDEYFRARPGPPRNHGNANAPRFISRVLRASSKAGRSIGRTLSPPRARPGASFGRGHVAARLAGRGLDRRARRVIVKTRLVLLHIDVRSTQKHLRYIERDGVTREGERGQLYGPETDIADGDAFERRCRDDRHQFRFIVSAQDGMELGDLQAFTRAHMAQVERDLGTKLDWVAVDHWDTDDPHTHIVLRGKDDRGADLVIARDYISHGMRLRAAELATDWLGRRSEREIASDLKREVTQERWTGLDRTLSAAARDGVVDLRNVPGEHGKRKHRALLIGRLEHLATFGLAERRRGGVWALHPDAEPTLRAMGERGDIIRTMQRALGGSRAREYVIADHRRAAAPLSGRIAGKGLSDELRDRGYLVVDSGGGCMHYLPLPPSAYIGDFPVGGLIEVRRGGLRVRAHEQAPAVFHRFGGPRRQPARDIAR